MKVNAIRHSRGFLKASLLCHKAYIQLKLGRNWRIRRPGSNCLSNHIKATNVLAKPTKSYYLPLGKKTNFFSLLNLQHFMCSTNLRGTTQVIEI